MAFIICLPTMLTPKATNLITMTLQCVGDNGVTNFSTDYVWDFTKTNSANLTACKSQVATSATQATGITYSSSNVFLVGGLV